MKPAILCLHGRGTSAMIFEIQAMAVVQQLEDDFDFIFVDAPNESEPGPNVLPIFEDEGPYYSWANRPGSADYLRNGTGLDATVALLDKVETTYPNLVGVLAFSQGVTIGLGLLLRQQRRRQMGLPSVGYRFGAFVGGVDIPTLQEGDEVDSGATTPTNKLEGSAATDILKIPTLLGTGSTDTMSRSSVGFQQWASSQKAIERFDFHGGHEMPRDRRDWSHLVDFILQFQ
ncbi:hypothetical protein VHEMI07625 [[Torrubiella] hemipterigena]|uniref:Serine hydrolase domain-containing protein n=1 Tax=[Torrubiella] hemipterigena TaxID=1531966 RepID=A0A0A1TLZ2_9HYPO|nr:hypothetical protein VHEMI07625 [[Torrubiella] hemipterigena]